MESTSTFQFAKRTPRLLAPIEMHVQSTVSRIADSDCPVLIEGEHGAGKRSIAAQIHMQSHRSRGAFTEIQSQGAEASVVLSALAQKGTVYLSEIGDLSLDIQGLIVDSYFHAEQAPLGRLLCGTSRELSGEVKSLRMRDDFFYLVSGVTLRVSPLRCRKSEILSIADDLLSHYSKQFDRPKPDLREEIVGFLLGHTWPGNFSELQTAIKTFVAIGDQSISLAALKAAASSAKSNENRKLLSLKEATRAASSEIERKLISEVLIATGGNRKRAADELGISYKALLYKIKQVETECPPAPLKNGVV